MKYQLTPELIEKLDGFDGCPGSASSASVGTPGFLDDWISMHQADAATSADFKNAAVESSDVVKVTVVKGVRKGQVRFSQEARGKEHVVTIARKAVIFGSGDVPIAPRRHGLATPSSGKFIDAQLTLPSGLSEVEAQELFSLAVHRIKADNGSIERVTFPIDEAPVAVGSRVTAKGITSQKSHRSYRRKRNAAQVNDVSLAAGKSGVTFTAKLTRAALRDVKRILVARARDKEASSSEAIEV